jgi:hypothetical protein
MITTEVTETTEEKFEKLRKKGKAGSMEMEKKVGVNGCSPYFLTLVQACSLNRNISVQSRMIEPAKRKKREIVNNTHSRNEVCE